MKSKMTRALSMLFALVMVLAAIPVMTSTAAAEAEEKVAYETLYVQDGLTLLFSGYDNTDANTTLDLTEGKWYNWLDKEKPVAERKFATLKSAGGVNWVSRATTTGKGFGVDMISTQRTNANIGGATYIDIGAANLPQTAAYTVEQVGNMLIASENGVRAATLGSYCYAYSTEKFGAWGTWSTTIDAKNGSRIVYHNDANWGDGDTWVNAKSGYTWSSSHVASNTNVIRNLNSDFMQYVEAEDGEYVYTLEVGSSRRTTFKKIDSIQKYTKDGDTYVEDANGLYVRYGTTTQFKLLSELKRYKQAYVGGWHSMRTMYDNADLQWTLDTAVNGTNEFQILGMPTAPSRYFETPAHFFLMRGVACTMYAVRVYDRALSADEINWNFMIDVCAYLDFNVQELAKIKNVSLKNVLAAEFKASYGYTSTTAGDAVTALFAEYAAQDAKITASVDAYDALYVKDGMTILLTAYDTSENNATVNLEDGYWANKLGGKGAKIQAGTTFPWQKDPEGGIYWTQKASVSASNQPNGIYFDIDQLPTGNYTVEQIITYDGITNDDGTKWNSTWQYKGTETGVSGNHYGHNVEAFAFGPMRSLSFLSQIHYKQKVDDQGNPVGDPTVSGDGAQNRWYYTGMAYGDHGSNPGNFGAAFHGKDYYWKNYAAGEVLYFGVTHQYEGGSTYDTATASVYTMAYNDDAEVTMRVNAGVAKNPSQYTETLLPSTAGYGKNGVYDASRQRFFTMVGVAGHVYAIRVYDKVLTDAERAQNHAVDLMAYFGLDVTGFAAATEEAKARVYETFAEKTFAATDLEQAVMQAAIDRAVEDSIVGVIVSQKSKDNTALRIVGALESMENVSRVGFVITFKQGGEVVKTFGDASVDNTATVTKTVFASVTADGVSYSASALCAEYLYAAVVKGIPAGTYTVEVTPFYVDVEDNAFTGEMKSQTVTFGS